MSFCDVNTNNASSGLRENVILNNLAPNISHYISHLIFGAKLVSKTLSLRPKEALLVLTLQKLVWIYYYYYYFILFCYME